MMLLLDKKEVLETASPAEDWKSGRPSDTILMGLSSLKVDAKDTAAKLKINAATNQMGRKEPIKRLSKRKEGKPSHLSLKTLATATVAKSSRLVGG